VGPRGGERPVKTAPFRAKGGGKGIYIPLFAPLTKVTPSPPPQQMHFPSPLRPNPTNEPLNG